MKVILHYIKPFIPRMSVGISIKFIGAVMGAAAALDFILPHR